MDRKQDMPRHPQVALLIACLFSFSAGIATGDDTDEVLSAIKRAGGTVRKSEAGLEIGFHLRGRKSANAALVHVSKLDNVVGLHLGNTNVTNEGLALLKNLKNLRWLHLENTGVDDAGIRHLVELKQLEYLNLHSTAITDKVILKLSQIENLKKLYVWQTKVSQDGINQLRKVSPQLRVVKGVDLSQLAASFPSEADEPKPKTTLDWVPVTQREDAPVRSDNGVNCQIWFENHSAAPVKLYWISYGAGELKFYAILKPKEVRKQNTYSKNAWLITDLQEKTLGYFIIKDDDARAIVPLLAK